MSGVSLWVAFSTVCLEADSLVLRLVVQRAALRMTLATY
jgi:hypothetical protein